MKTIKEINELLQEGKTEEAYKEVTEYYNAKKDEVSLLYLTLLDLDFNYYTLSNDEFITRFERLINSKKKQIRQRAYEPYLSLLLDIEDYERCYNVSTKAKQEGMESFLINLGYAKGSIEYKEIKTEEIIYENLKAPIEVNTKVGEVIVKKGDKVQIHKYLEIEKSKTKLYVGGELLVDLVIPESVTTIEDYAFSDCNNLEQIHLPFGLQKIGEGAFYNCKKFRWLAISPTYKNIREIGRYAFNNCDFGRAFGMNTYVEKIGKHAFPAKTDIKFFKYISKE